MFDIGWTEMVLVAVIALIVVGPQEFPRLLRTVGQWVGRARSMVAQIQYAVNEAAAETDLNPNDWANPNKIAPKAPDAVSSTNAQVTETADNTQQVKQDD